MKLKCHLCQCDDKEAVSEHLRCIEHFNVKYNVWRGILIFAGVAGRTGHAVGSERGEAPLHPGWWRHD